MSEETKRRRLSLAWSLPVVVAIMLLVVAKLAALERAQMIKELDDRVSHGATEEATDAVRSLAHIPRPPLALLVKAAASPNLEVAREAQRAIDEYLRFCQREVNAERSLNVVARQLAVLAEALVIEQRLFAATDYPWVQSTARKVLRLANAIPSKLTPLVAQQCDRILSPMSTDKSNANAPSATTDTGGQSPFNDTPAPSGGVEGVLLDGAMNVPVQGPDERLATLAARPWSVAPTDQRLGAGDTTTTLGAAARQFPVTLETPVTRRPSVGLDFGDDPLTGVSDEDAGQSSWKAQWSHPILRSLPTAPIHNVSKPRDRADSAQDQSSTANKNESQLADAADQPFGRADSRKLLSRWQVAEGRDVRPLEQELIERGFGRLSPQWVEQLLSDQAEERLRLIDDVLKNRDVDARPWLLLLADDADGDVRLSAVTVMATSNDPELIEKAWQVAIRDRDPRIAGLAERLRERRSGIRRR